MHCQLMVVPHGGLCNRLRTLLSAFAAAQQGRLDVVVEWGRDRECWAFFDELFEPVVGESFLLRHRSFWNNYISRKNLRLPGLLRLFIYDKQQSLYDPRTHGALLDFVSHHRRVYISTGYELMPYSADLTKLLRPLPHLQSQIEGLTRNFDAHTIGVHIRRTDHVVAKANSRLEDFHRALEKEIQKYPDTKFYLATDDDALKAEMIQRYPGRLIVQQTHCNRNTLQGIEEAVVDLWALSSTSKILGSFFSSYSDMAAEIGNIPLCVVKADS